MVAAAAVCYIRLEVLQAISSGAYRLQPVGLAEGELTPYEEAMAGVAAGGAAATPTAPGSGKQRRSPGSSSRQERRGAAVRGEGELQQGRAVAMLLQPAVVLARLQTTWT